VKATSIALPKKVKQSTACHPERGEGSLQLCSPQTAGMFRGVYPERTAEILRFAQNDKRTGSA
jgi:hypothetical protein